MRRGAPRLNVVFARMDYVGGAFGLRRCVMTDVPLAAMLALDTVLCAIEDTTQRYTTYFW